ncbi:glutathione S-transferase family protein [Hyalangium versicolor]|uniref:glutathione S-transferase family protein n=1 Tax=Hyalangium versicolor TaxID=2861190 RepID=UPI001CCD25A0|nr:glutathione S-transferase family protein [Hyalangium versicolor]
MIILHQGPAAWGVANISPFCLKLESYLRMTGLPYKARLADFGKAPKGKIPFIEEDGKYLGDSQLIIEHLQGKHGGSMDAKLSAENRARGHLVRRVLEESVYQHILQERWASDDGWRVYKPVFEGFFPPVVGAVAAPLIRRKVVQGLHRQGLGRHQTEEILEMGKEDLSAVATVLGDKPFLLGDSPTSFDATVYAFIASILVFPLDTPLRRFTQEQKNLVQYVDRFQQRFFANWSPPA